MPDIEIAGSLLYLGVTMVATFGFNVPLNDALAKIDPASSEGARFWTSIPFQLDRMEPRKNRRRPRRVDVLYPSHLSDGTGRIRTTTTQRKEETMQKILILGSTGKVGHVLTHHL